MVPGCTTTPTLKSLRAAGSLDLRLAGVAASSQANGQQWMFFSQVFPLSLQQEKRLMASVFVRPCRAVLFGRGDGKLTCGDLDDPVPRFVQLSGRSGAKKSALLRPVPSST